MTNTILEIKQAIDRFDVEKARALLREELRINPTAEVYYLASQVAINEQQKIQFLQKTVELDPFHQQANALLAGQRMPFTPPTRPNQPTQLGWFKAFSFIYEDSGWWMKVVIGAFFMVAGFFTLGLLWTPVYGYILNTMEQILQKQGITPLPRWDDFGNHIKKGIAFDIISAFYSFPVFFGMGIADSMLSSAYNGRPPEQAVATAALFFVPLLLGLLFVIPTAICEYLYKGSFWVAFNVPMVLFRSVLNSWRLVIVYIMYTPIIVISILVTGITIAGFPFGLFITWMMMGYLFALVYIKSIGQSY